MKTRTIRQSVTFKASSHAVYEALMDSRKHARFTGGKARISRKVGGGFTAYDGWLGGTNLQLVPGKRIVQLWRCEASGWPEDHYSRATFSLKKIQGGTRLSFTQSGVPDICYDEINQGWRENYWTPMKEMLEKP
jgi:activator of HSP90 ATPase